MTRIVTEGGNAARPRAAQSGAVRATPAPARRTAFLSGLLPAVGFLPTIGLLAALTLVAAPVAATAQTEAARGAFELEGGEAEGPATLQADQVVYNPETDTVRAVGDVEVFYAGRVLRADEIIYEAATDTIIARGEITIVNPDGSVLVADEAELDSELRNGFVRGARAVLADGQSRIAAVEGRRVDGRFTTLSRAVFSPCPVCEDRPTPFWRIRASSIVQDDEVGDIIYEDATFEILGVPVAYLPAFRHADPTVRRRSGFLTPQFSSSSVLGYSVATPYFWAIAPNRDITLTPHVYTSEYPRIEGEYRQLTDLGQYRIGGSLTFAEDPDDRDEDVARWHIEGDGEFRFAGGIEAGYEALLASDDTFLRRYDISSTDRAETRVYVQRFGDDGFFAVETARYQSFRSDEPAGTVPLVAPAADFEQRLASGVFGGDIGVRGDVLVLHRTEGRDVVRLSGETFWEADVATSFGLVLEAYSSVRGDGYYIQDDGSIQEELQGRLLPLAALTASYPLGRGGERSMEIFEPIGQIVWSPYGGNDDVEIPNEDSQDAELDELNIFSYNRFAGLDRWEEGPRATIGLRYQRLSTGRGLNFETTLGQSFRFRDAGAFALNSGLRNDVSSFVGSWRLWSERSFSLSHRFRLSDQDGSFERNEVYATAQPFDWLSLNGSYVFLVEVPEAGAPIDRSEARGGFGIDLTDNWSISGRAQRDLEFDRFVSAGGGIHYSNECLEVDLTLSRRFNDIEDAPASTTFGLNIRLIGIE